jgi:hypothetical protein
LQVAVCCKASIVILSADLYSHLGYAVSELATAIEITQTISIPSLFHPGVESISILGVASDGMTTFHYFVPDPEESTTFTGMALSS